MAKAVCTASKTCAVHIWKETYTYGKRPTHMLRDLHIQKENYKYGKRYRYIRKKACKMARAVCTASKTCRVYIWKKTYPHEKWPSHMERDTNTYVKRRAKWRKQYVLPPRLVQYTYERDLHIWKETYPYEKRPTHMKRDGHIWKETYTYEKRPTYMKRDLEYTYIYEKRPHIWKRPTHMKRDLETYIYEKRPHIWKRPTHMQWDLNIWREI